MKQTQPDSARLHLLQSSARGPEGQQASRTPVSPSPDKGQGCKCQPPVPCLSPSSQAHAQSCLYCSSLPMAAVLQSLLISLSPV